MTPPERITLKKLCSNFLRDFTQAERGLWGTIVQLTFRPRRVVETFLFKDRAQFMRPTRYLIFCLSLAAFQLVAVQFRYGTSVHEYKVQQVETQKTAEEAANISEPYTTGREIGLQASTSYLHYFFSLLIPFVVFMYFCLFPIRGFNYAESLSAATYIHAHRILLFTVVSIPFLLFREIGDFITLQNYGHALAYFYLLAATLGVFLKGWQDLAWLPLRGMVATFWQGITVIMLMALVFLFFPEFTKELFPDVDLKAGLIIFFISLVLVVFTTRIMLFFKNGWPIWWHWLLEVVVTFAIIGLVSWAV